jgi:hypothetical protein
MGKDTQTEINLARLSKPMSRDNDNTDKENVSKSNSIKEDKPVDDPLDNKK